MWPPPSTRPRCRGRTAADILDGYDACLAALVAADPRAAGAEVLACSSAGGGLRIAVVGNEELVTAEAGRRVALSSGGKVVHVLAGRRRRGRLRRAPGTTPDVVLLTGGTDGGNGEVLLDAARGWSPAAGRARWWSPATWTCGTRWPRCSAGCRTCWPTTSCRGSGCWRRSRARAAIREMFLAHVIGGKHLSARTDFTAMVRGATPDVVLTGVELLARGLDEAHPGVGDVVVVDVGGATTDVHSVVEVDPEDGRGGLAREVVATTPVTRTVEGDLGMRWSAAPPSEAAGRSTTWRVAAAAGAATSPASCPAPTRERDEDEAIARAAVGLALRRHAGRSRVVLSPEGRVVERTGKDLREVELLVGSGGVLRHGRPGVAGRVLAGSTGADVEGAGSCPRAPRVVVDADYVLAAAGLLAGQHPEAAYRLALRCARAGVYSLSR